MPARDIGNAHGSSQGDSDISNRSVGPYVNQRIAMDQHEEKRFAGAIRSLPLQGKQSMKQFFVVQVFRLAPGGVPYVSICHED